MKKGMYLVYKILFGLYLIWMGLSNLNNLQANENHVKRTIENFEKGFSIEDVLNFLNLGDFFTAKSINIKHLHINFEPAKASAREIVYLMNASLILGGILCVAGFSISFSFIFVGLFLNILFIHNLYYFRDEKMKVTVLKMISILGGAFYII